MYTTLRALSHLILTTELYEHDSVINPNSHVRQEGITEAEKLP